MQTHRCRFVPVSDKLSITQIAITPDFAPSGVSEILDRKGLDTVGANLREPFIALARSNGDIEWWMANPMPFSDGYGNNSIKNWKHMAGMNWICRGRIPGGDGVLIEALAWGYDTEAYADVSGNHASEDSDSASDSENMNIDTEFLSKTGTKVRLIPRLFAATSDGILVEYSLNKLAPIHSTDSHGGGAIWCMEISPSNTHLVIGCEDGAIRLFDISGGGLSYVKSFAQRQKGRIVCLKWFDENTLISGGSGAENQVDGGSIRKWDAKSGTILQRMSIGYASSAKLSNSQSVDTNEDLFVWSVDSVGSTCFVSGDSMGQLKIWDFNTGTTLFNYSHGSDIISVKSSNDGQCIFAAALDGKILQFLNINNRWSLSLTRKFHQQDLRCLVWAKHEASVSVDSKKRRREKEQTRKESIFDVLISGGVDGYLTVLPRPRETFRRSTTQPARFPRLNLENYISFSRKSRMVSGICDNKVGIWKIGEILDKTPEESNLSVYSNYEPAKYLKDVSEPAKYLCEIQTQKKLNPYSAKLSTDGEFLIICEQTGLKLYRIKTNQENKSRYDIQDYSDVFINIPVCKMVDFSRDNSFLSFVTTENTVISGKFSFDCAAETIGCKFEHTLQFKVESLILGIKSTKDNRLIVWTVTNEIFVLDIATGNTILDSSDIVVFSEGAISNICPLEIFGSDKNSKSEYMLVIVATPRSNQFYIINLKTGKMQQKIQNCLNSLSWLKKRKEKIIDAFSTRSGKIIYLYTFKWLGRISVESLLQTWDKYRKAENKLEKKNEECPDVHHEVSITKYKKQFEDSLKHTMHFSNIMYFDLLDDSRKESKIESVVLEGLFD